MSNDPSNEDAEGEMPDNIAPLAMAFESGLAVLAIILGMYFSHSPVQTIDAAADKPYAHLIACLWGVAATIPLVAMLLFLERVPWAVFRELSELVDEKIIPMFAESTTLQLALLSFAAGVGEELLFRGLLQDGLAMKIGGARGLIIGIAVASLLFGLCHSMTRAYFVLATIMGLYLGLLFWWTDNLLAPIVAHALYDFIAIAYMLHGKPKAEEV